MLEGAKSAERGTYAAAIKAQRRTSEAIALLCNGCLVTRGYSLAGHQAPHHSRKLVS